MKNMGMAKLLIAVNPQDRQLVYDVLGEEFDILVCHNFVEAEKILLNEDIRLVACGVHFDGGRMFDLLNLVRQTPKSRDIPFLLALGRNPGYTPAILDGIEAAAASLGATAFINMLELICSMGQEAAYEDIKRTVLRLLIISSINRSITPFMQKSDDRPSSGEEPHCD